jgi:hypothetical protein
MNDNGKMSANSAVVLECLIGVVAFGILSFFYEPKYAMGVGLVIGALIGVLNNASGVKSGSTLPEQVGAPKPGQTSETDTHTKSGNPEPPLPNPQAGDPSNPL